MQTKQKWVKIESNAKELFLVSNKLNYEVPNLINLRPTFDLTRRSGLWIGQWNQKFDFASTFHQIWHLSSQNEANWSQFTLHNWKAAFKSWNFVLACIWPTKFKIKRKFFCIMCIKKVKLIQESSFSFRIEKAIVFTG